MKRIAFLLMVEISTTRKRILISGDGDFERALQLLKSRGKEVKVISTRGSVASELVHTTGINYIDLLAIKETVERKPIEEDTVA